MKLLARRPSTNARTPFVSVGYYPTKTMVDGTGVEFKPGAFARAYLTWDLLGDKLYLYADNQFTAAKPFSPKLFYIDAGVATRPFDRFPRWNFDSGPRILLTSRIMTSKPVYTPVSATSSNAFSHARGTHMDAAQRLLAIKRDFLVPCTYHFYQRPPVLVRGEGAYLFDTEGRAYLDCYSGVTVVNAGHCNSEIVEAAIEQMRRLQHTTSVYLTEPVLELARLIAEMTPAGLRRSFFCASGSEANEGALLLATLATERNECAYLTGGLHGRTKWAMSVTGLDMWRTDPQPACDRAWRAGTAKRRMSAGAGTSAAARHDCGGHRRADPGQWRHRGAAGPITGRSCAGSARAMALC